MTELFYELPRPARMPEAKTPEGLPERFANASRMPTADEVTSTEQHRRDLERANARGMTLREYRVWRANLRADFKAIRSPGKISATSLSFALLFFLLDPDAALGVVMANRPLTPEEQRQYSASAMCQRRRKAGETVDDDEARALKRRSAALSRELEADTR